MSVDDLVGETSSNVTWGIPFIIPLFLVVTKLVTFVAFLENILSLSAYHLHFLVFSLLFSRSPL